MAASGFIFGGDDLPATPQELASRRRAAAGQLVMGNLLHPPQNVGQGLSAIGHALMARQMMDDANAGTAAGQKSDASTWAPVIAAYGGPGVGSLAPSGFSLTSSALPPFDPSKALGGTLGMGVY